MTDRTVKLTFREARVVGHALAFHRLADAAWPDWDEYPYLDEDSRERVMAVIAMLGDDILRIANALVDDPDELDRLLQRAQYGGDS